MPGKPESESDGVLWRVWGPAAFEEAAAADRPVLLNLSAAWCQWSRRMAATTYTDAGLIRTLNDCVIPIRADADRYPHVQERYIAGGWPTTAFLTPTGEVLWAGTYVEAAELTTVVAGVLAAWRNGRPALEAEIERRRRALDAARGRPHTLGLVRREAADDVVTAIRDTFDARNGGFGDAPKFPQTDVLELLYTQAGAEPDFAHMADQTLDGMLAGELWDAVDGGFFRYTLAADWTAPRHEKLLAANALQLEAYALGAWCRGRADWVAVAAKTVAWVEATLANASGLWGASQQADPDYFNAPKAVRSELARPAVDATLLTSSAARWIGALALAGARLERGAWVARADAALQTLLTLMRSPRGGLYHFHAAREPQLDFLLDDTLQTARAALAVAQATGSTGWLDVARVLARHLEAEFWADDGGFYDRGHTDPDVGAMRYRDRPFEQNAEAARLLLDLAHLTGERGWRARAERTLARLGPAAGRFGVGGAGFALAIDEFFDPPLRVFIATTAAARARGDALRAAAFRLGLPSLRVWSVPSGWQVGPHRFDADNGAGAWVWTRRGCTGPCLDADHLRRAL